jgi:hypothetical protein
MGLKTLTSPTHPRLLAAVQWENSGPPLPAARVDGLTKPEARPAHDGRGSGTLAHPPGGRGRLYTFTFTSVG